jgi:16S rRNA (adenine1518-N6/adenine1519-N6)-dimethyltransferase
MPRFFTIKEIQHLCQQYGFNPSKEYGQNYLLNLEPIEKMIAAADLKKTDTVVEVGPGFGVLTFALAEESKEVVSFEIEKKLQPYWEEQTKDFHNIRIEWGNVLYQFKEKAKNFKKYKVVANLPYQITSPILKLFLEDVENQPESMVLLVQKEVAERICAKPGDMSVLAVAVQFFGVPEIVSPVLRHLFWPVPQVDSAIIKINDIQKSRFVKQKNFSISNFFKFVRAGFLNRRKLLQKNLLAIVGKENKAKIDNIWQELGWDHNRRAQELSVGEWVKLFGLWQSI